MAVAALPQGSVLGSADGVVLRGHARPMIGRFPQTRMNGLAAHDPSVFAGTPGHGGHPAQTSQSGVISAPDRIEGFREQGGQDDSADAGQGGEDRHVPARSLGPRRRLAPLLPSPDQTVELTRDVPELVPHHGQALTETFDVDPHRLGGARGDREGAYPQATQDLWGVDTPDPMLFQHLGDPARAQLPGRIRCRGQLPHFLTQGSARSLLRCRNCG